MYPPPALCTLRSGGCDGVCALVRSHGAPLAHACARTDTHARIHEDARERERARTHARTNLQRQTRRHRNAHWHTRACGRAHAFTSHTRPQTHATRAAGCRHASTDTRARGPVQNSPRSQCGGDAVPLLRRTGRAWADGRGVLEYSQWAGERADGRGHGGPTKLQWRLKRLEHGPTCGMRSHVRPSARVGARALRKCA